MSQAHSSSQNDPQHPSRQEIRRLPGTLYFLAITSDAETACNLKTDLSRSQLYDFKLQICGSLETATSLLAASRFHLLFLDLKHAELTPQQFESLRGRGFDFPIVGMASRRAINEQRFRSFEGLDELVAAEDLSPSLVEMMARHALERRALQQSRDLLRDRLQLSLSADRQGQWTYFPKEDRMELDAVTAAMLGFPPRPTVKSLSEIAARSIDEDRETLESSLQCLEGEDRELNCCLRLKSDSLPAPTIEFIGRTSPPNSLSSDALIGVARQGSSAESLVQRLLEANTEVQALLDARDEALRLANRKLRAIASEFSVPPRRAEKEAAPPPEKRPLGLFPTGEEGPDEDCYQQEEESVPPPSVQEDRPEDPRAKPAEPAPGQPSGRGDHGSDATSSPPEGTALPATSPASTAKPQPHARPGDQSLSIDEKRAFKDVMKSIGKEVHRSDHSHQQSFAFDFSLDPISEYTPADPAEDGFVAAAKSLVNITQRSHDLDISLSISDQQSIALEAEQELLYDVLKELLLNVVKHAQASLCVITLFRDEDEWVLQVEDDGVGISGALKSVSTPLKQLGLFKIRTQLALKGGHLDLTPASPSGLVARVRLPYHSTAKAAR